MSDALPAKQVKPAYLSSLVLRVSVRVCLSDASAQMIKKENLEFGPATLVNRTQFRRVVVACSGSERASEGESEEYFGPSG